MARFLFACQPIVGHVLPALPIVSELVARGHEVGWYAGEKYRTRIETTGATFHPFVLGLDYDDDDYDSAFPGRRELKGLSQIRYDFTKIFVEQAAPQHRDLCRILEDFPADVVVGDPATIAAVTVNERGGPPNAVYNITCLGIGGREVAPFGLGLLPNGTLPGRIRNRVLDWVAPNVVFRGVSAALKQQCREIGVPERKFTGVATSPFLFLQPTATAFEYPRSDLPPQVHFVGALLPDPPTTFEPPTWWAEVEARHRPVVLVTQGTVATSVRDLIAPTLVGLADDDVTVIAAGVKDPAELGLVELPGNAHVERFVPFTPLLPHVDVYVTNGGFGGVQYALSNGVPMVAAGTTEDKPEICNRIRFTGTGINLKTSTPAPEQVAGAVRTVLQDGRYREAAKGIAAELAGHDAAAESADLLERLAGTGAPVLRS